MPRIFRNRSIEKKVMGIVREAIDVAQKEHDEEVEKLEKVLEETLKKAHEAHEEKLLTIVSEGVRKVFDRLKQ